MRRNVFTKTAQKHVGAWVVSTLAVLFVSNGSFAQIQRSPTESSPHDAGWARPTISEPSRPYLSDPSASGGSGSGLAGTTPILHESAKLTASDAWRGDYFGFSVSIDGNAAIIGAPSANCISGAECGAVYVFRYDGTSWIEEQKLIASDAVRGLELGRAVSVSGDTIIAGANSSAYVFRFNGAQWAEEQKLTASDTSEHIGFGSSVSVSDDRVGVGALRADCAGSSTMCGAAYIFQFDGTNWVEEQRLTASNAAAGDRFGFSVSLNGNTALVGAISRGCTLHGDEDCGAAFVFGYDGYEWIEVQELTASDSAGRNMFGESVSVSGETAVVGASDDDCAGKAHRCGAAYVFQFNGSVWVEEQKLNASDATPGARFGWSVATSGSAVIVGARLDGCGPGGLGCGSAYVFQLNESTWVEERKLTAFDTAQTSEFGHFVSVSDDTALVGSFADNCAEGIACGSAYVFDLGPDDLEVTIDIKPGNESNPVNLGARGVLPVAVLTTSVADGDLTDFGASDVDPYSLTLAGAAPRMKGRSGRVGSLADIDGDGDLDLLLHFPIAELELTIEDTEAVLLGQTFDGTTIRGSDTITAIQAQRIGADNLLRAE